MVVEALMLSLFIKIDLSMEMITAAYFWHTRIFLELQASGYLADQLMYV